MLNQYITNTQLLLSNPAAPTTLYSSANLTQFINTARLQMAGETECIVANLTLTTTAGVSVYKFSSVSGFPSGTNNIFDVRQIFYVSGSGQIYVGPRPYPWAQIYWINNPTPTQGPPSEWAQYAPGATGSILLNPIPDIAYNMILDCSCQPVSLVDDTTVEAIPYAFTDAVPFFAAYYAYMSAQRQQDAEQMLQRYNLFVARAKGIAVPNEILPSQYSQFVGSLNAMQEQKQQPDGQAG